ncbi:MAG: hypothetical protein Q8L60_04150 [Gammaproteobacteria bacterium]|nr:hypothetical protein [Gammaproteobacteria bacterium]MDP2347118.1 hypothetical protein [Gammaproteobacteria bacterium]
MLIHAQRAASRYSAAAFHFALSFAVFTLLVGVLLIFWYPSPYFSASGGWQGLRIVAAVDLVLGPIITLVIFNTTKSRRELIIDMSVVIVMQLFALAWGVKAVYDQRPVAVVFSDTSFFTVPAAALTVQGVDVDMLSEFGEGLPVYVFVQRPDSGPDLERFTYELNDNRIPPHEQVWLYQPLIENFATISRSSVDIKEVMAANADMKVDIEGLLDDTGTALDDNFYIALTSRYRNIILVFDGQGRILGTVSAPYKSGDV